MTREHGITIRGGRVEFIHDEALSEIFRQVAGPGQKTRASHVEPVSWVLRWLFHAIRSRVADGSGLAEWTRSWSCLWRARIFDGPTLGPYRDRAEAIAAEIEWLENMLGTKAKARSTNGVTFRTCH